jgi:hypothetical protein
MSSLERKINAVKREARDMSLAADVLVDLDRSDFDKKYYPCTRHNGLRTKVDIKVDVDGYRDARRS